MADNDYQRGRADGMKEAVDDMVAGEGKLAVEIYNAIGRKIAAIRRELSK